MAVGLEFRNGRRRDPVRGGQRRLVAFPADGRFRRPSGEQALFLSVFLVFQYEAGTHAQRVAGQVIMVIVAVLADDGRKETGGTVLQIRQPAQLEVFVKCLLVIAYARVAQEREIIRLLRPVPVRRIPSRGVLPWAVVDTDVRLKEKLVVLYAEPGLHALAFFPALLIGARQSDKFLRQVVPQPDTVPVVFISAVP